MEITAQDAVSALAAHVGIPLDLRGGSCELLVGDQPFSISHDAALERLVVSALVADDLPAVPRSSRRSSATLPTWRRRPQVSLFRRDLIPHIAKPGWFEE